PPAYTSPSPALGPARYATPAYVSTRTALPPRKSDSALILVIVVVVCALAGGAAWFAANINREKPEERIGRLMREAAGLQPVKKAFFSQDQKFDDTFREQYRNLFRINKEYVAAVKNADISAVAQLSTPASFADPSSAAEGLRQLHAVYDL